jgi:hypothetical protein
MSVDTNATSGEKDNNVIESVQDGMNELLSDVSSSATNIMKETTVSHLNESRQNIVVDGKLYRCNKVRVVGEKRKLCTRSICSVGWLWIKPMGQSGSLTMK